MRIPKMQASPQYMVTIPKLDGGVNLKDAPHLVEDNQLTDICNMWWKDQALRTRPGLMTDAEKCVDIGERIGTDTGYYNLRRESDYFNVDTYIDGSLSAVLIDSEYCLEESGGAERFSADIRVCSDKGDISALASIPNTYSVGMISQCVVHKDTWYVFMTGGQIYKYKPDSDGQHVFTKVEPYVPLVALNGKGYVSGTDKGSFAFSGTFYEGYNLLTGAFKVTYTTNGKDNIFPLPIGDLSSYPGEDIVIKFTQHNGEVTTFNIPWDKWYSNERDYTVDDFMTDENNATVVAEIDRKNGIFYFKANGQGQSEIRYVAPDPSVQNNLEITAWSYRTGKIDICAMRFHTWFGGDGKGINGGTRLFMAGDKRNPNLVCWSAINNPLYFPENSNSRIGDYGQAITAFGKQSDMLVIFKEHELFYSTYQSGSFDWQDVYSGNTVVDVETSSAAFPIFQINACIGCDCPHTIQLCNNRLVWATSDGKVYTLTSSTPYSERNVRELSGMIEASLKLNDSEALKNASSGDYAGHYVLQVGNSLYLLDYNSSGYEHNTSYTGRNAEKHMPWYIWSTASDGVTWKRFFSSGDNGLLIGEKSMNDTVYRIVCVLGDGKDYGVDYNNGLQFSKTQIHSMFQTKLFDFGRPERRKNARKLHIGATDVADGYITLSYVTEFGTQEDAYRIGMYGDGDMRVWAVTPHVNRMRRFGIRADSAGAMAVDGMVIRYEVYGEVR